MMTLMYSAPIMMWSNALALIGTTSGVRRGAQGPLQPLSDVALWAPPQPYGRLLMGDEGCHRRRTVFCQSPSVISAHPPGAYGASRAIDLCILLVADSVLNFTGAACSLVLIGFSVMIALWEYVVHVKIGKRGVRNAILLWVS